LGHYGAFALKDEMASAETLTVISEGNDPLLHIVYTYFHGSKHQKIVFPVCIPVADLGLDLTGEWTLSTGREAVGRKSIKVFTVEV